MWKKNLNLEDDSFDIFYNDCWHSWWGIINNQQFSMIDIFEIFLVLQINFQSALTWEESKRKHLLSIRARKRAIDGDIARARSFSVADNDFNDTSGTVRLCLTTLVKVTTGVLNDQFASRQCRYMHRYNAAHNGTAGGVENSRVAEYHVCTRNAMWIED